MLDLELLASIASGGLGQWVEGQNGPAYAKSEDCIGAPACGVAACQVEGRRGARLAGAGKAAPPSHPSSPGPAPPCCWPCVPGGTLASNSSRLGPAGCLKDLQRFFRADDPEERPAFFAVHKYNLVRAGRHCPGSLSGCGTCLLPPGQGRQGM